MQIFLENYLEIPIYTVSFLELLPITTVIFFRETFFSLRTDPLFDDFVNSISAFLDTVTFSETLYGSPCEVFLYYETNFSVNKIVIPVLGLPKFSGGKKVFSRKGPL